MSPRRKREVVVVRDVLLHATYRPNEGVPADTVVQGCLNDLLSSAATDDGADPLHGLRMVKIETATQAAPASAEEATP